MALEGIYRARIRRSRAATIALFAALRERLACDPMSLWATGAAPSDLLRFLASAGPDVRADAITVMGELDPLPVPADRHLADALARHPGAGYVRLEYTDAVAGGPYIARLGPRADALEELRSVAWSTNDAASIGYDTGMNALDPAGGVRASPEFLALREARVRAFVDACLAALGLRARYDVLSRAPNEAPNELLANVVAEPGPVAITAGINGASLELAATPEAVPSLRERVVALLASDVFAPRRCTSFVEGTADELARIPVVSEVPPTGVFLGHETSVAPSLLERLDTLPAPFDLTLTSGFGLEGRGRARSRGVVKLQGHLELHVAPRGAQILVAVRYGLLPAQQALLEERAGVRFDHVMDA